MTPACAPSRQALQRSERFKGAAPQTAAAQEVAALYARLAGKPLKVSHLPAGVARVMSVLARPLHPGMARLMHLLSLPDDAFDETFDGAGDLEHRFGIRLTRLEAFVAARVRKHAAA